MHHRSPLLLLAIAGLAGLLANAPNVAAAPPASEHSTISSALSGNATPRTCDITDMASLKHCAADPRQFDRLSLRQDLTCASAGKCCGPDNTPLIRLNDVARYVFDGNNHTIHRGADTHACGVIAMNHSSNIVIENVSLDEGATVPPCELAEKQCQNTIVVNESRDVLLNSVHAHFCKGYVARVWGTDGFSFTHSSLSDSGMIRLYVGHYKFTPSRNIIITDSVLERALTNGVAIQGADNVLIACNTFTGNHWHGLWPVKTIPNGTTTGGQTLITHATQVRITGNVISDSECGNCNPPRQVVSGLELGGGDRSVQSVSGIMVDSNDFSAAVAVHLNGAPTVTGLKIENNRLHGPSKLTNLAR